MPRLPVRRRPWVWGLLYVLLIPSFGLVYWLLPTGSLMASTIGRESYVQGDAVQLLGALTTELRSRSTPYSLEVFGRTLTTEPGTIEARTLRVEDDGRLLIETSVQATERDADSRLISTAYLSLTVELLLRERLSTTDANGTRVSYGVVRTDQGGPLVLPVAAIYPPVGLVSADSATGSGVLTVDLGVSSQMVRFHNAVRGEPKHASGYFVRSMYLSVVTVTTLGFGDITPLSSTARVLVGLEAVLGVVSAGFFISAAAAASSKRASPSGLGVVDEVDSQDRGETM